MFLKKYFFLVFKFFLPKSHSSHNGPIWFSKHELLPVLAPPRQFEGAFKQYIIYLDYGWALQYPFSNKRTFPPWEHYAWSSQGVHTFLSEVIGSSKL